MKLDKTQVLASIAALLVVGAVGGSLLSLKAAEAAADELAATRHSISEQVEISKRLEAELAGKLTRTDAMVFGLAQSFADLQGQRGATPSSQASDAESGDALAPTEEAATLERTEQTTETIERAEALIASAARAGRWTEQDRDQLQELLVQVDGPAHRRLQDSVGKLLVERKIVADDGFVPL